MSNHAAVEAARQLFNEHPQDVVGMVNIGAEKLYELGGLFEAIGAAAQENTLVQRLASIGSYLAEDAGNMLDERQEHYGKRLKGA
ncbi:hypothetical protein [Luteimonas aquatica]|uniref:hypothetical protein n=1 Tax=Luteimonas aquatica TaxID=450364 RepID=UPI001F57E8FA|nr:hypothetical protein [Luteimonas aquatica]